jgi:hypothetical protein
MRLGSGVQRSFLQRQAISFELLSRLKLVSACPIPIHFSMKKRKNQLSRFLWVLKALGVSFMLWSELSLCASNGLTPLA